MTKLSERKHSRARLEGLLYKGSGYLVKGISEEEFNVWKKSVLFHGREVFGDGSSELESLQRIFTRSDDECEYGEPDGKYFVKALDVMRLATSLLYKYLVKLNRESAAGAEEIAGKIREVSEQDE